MSGNTDSRMPEIFLLVESGWALQSGIPLTTVGIRNPSSTDKESRFQYLESGVHIPRLCWITIYGPIACWIDSIIMYAGNYDLPLSLAFRLRPGI